MSTENPQTGPKIQWIYADGFSGVALNGMLDFEITYAKEDAKSPAGYRVTIKGAKVATLSGRDSHPAAAKARAERWLAQVTR